MTSTTFYCVVIESVLPYKVGKLQIEKKKHSERKYHDAEHKNMHVNILIIESRSLTSAGLNGNYIRKN